MNHYLINKNEVRLIDELSIISSNLEAGIYQINKDMSGLYLNKVASSFNLPEKIYSVDKGLVNRVMKVWSSTKESFGIMMMGLKGSGKTYVAKILASRLNLPVIVVSEPDELLQNFLSGLTGQAIIIFDEFEKSFDKDDQNDILTILDGLYSSSDENRKLFIFTANNFWRINENLIGRPGRIRYYVEMNNVPADVVKEVINDNLDKQYISNIPEIINFINSLENVTIDVIKSVIEEINMFGPDFEEIKSLMNLEYIKAKYAALGVKYVTYSVEMFKKLCSTVDAGEDAELSLKVEEDEIPDYMSVSLYKAPAQYEIGDLFEFGENADFKCCYPLDKDNVIGFERNTNGSDLEPYRMYFRFTNPDDNKLKSKFTYVF